MDFDALWHVTLQDLQLQMTQSTFDAWLRGTVGMGQQDGTLLVAVGSEYAREWLENRLDGIIARTVARRAGQEIPIQFVVVGEAEDERRLEPAAPSPPVPGFVLPEYDVHEAGWFPVSEYESRFWAPILRRIAWRVWEIVRKGDKRKRKTDWTPRQRWTAPALAEQVPCGRQSLTGVTRRCEEGEREEAWLDEKEQWRYHQPGAFDRLREEGIAMIERRGRRRHTTYLVSVRVQLGLLLPEQVLRLPARLQVEHDRWLEERGFDPQEWDR